MRSGSLQRLSNETLLERSIIFVFFTQIILHHQPSILASFPPFRCASLPYPTVFHFIRLSKVFYNVVISIYDIFSNILDTKD